MNKDEMVEEMAKITNFTAFDYRQGTIQSKTIYTAMAEAIYNANYRKVADDEIVIKKSEYEDLRLAKYKAMEEAIEYEKTAYKQLEQAKQETAREILQELWCKRMAFTDLQFTICYLMAQYDIELED